MNTDIHKLVMWRDLTPHPQRLVQPTLNSPHVCASFQGERMPILLAYANFNERLTAQIAGALWEFPPAVCGSHTDSVSLSHAKRWCMTAYHAWDAIASVPAISHAAGVRMLPGRTSSSPDPGVRGFRHAGPTLAQERNILSPVIDTDQGMMWLMSLVLGKGASTITESIDGDLLDLEPTLLARFKADAIVNATGLSGSTVAGDKTCYPLRGALIRVINDGRGLPQSRRGAHHYCGCCNRRRNHLPRPTE
ncbi:hypothetical protein C8F01DRAFT_1175687 [Mycena amicta]|nr:hypothetical protein C8F01DRAFT_1175687 [Mycena amicta]